MKAKSIIQDLPRERLVNKGVNTLSDSDLLAILLGSGTKGLNVTQVAKKVLAVFDKKGSDLNFADLTDIYGIGLAKATLVLAALEFCRRRIRPKGQKISSAKDLYPLLLHLADRKQEHFICISLNGANEVIEKRIITVGLLNVCQVHPREVFSDAIVDRAASIVVAHNHPSGNLAPSDADIHLTKRLKEAAKIIGIQLLDHIIFSENSFLSFQEEKLI